MALIANKADCKMANIADVIVCTRFNRLLPAGSEVEHSGIYRWQSTGVEKVFSKGDILPNGDSTLNLFSDVSDVSPKSFWKLVVQAEESITVVSVYEHY